MRRSSQPTSRVGDSRLLLAVAALSLLAMPVEYRGGAEQPHPHIFFQIWIDAAHGSFAHHLFGAAGEDGAMMDGHAGHGPMDARAPDHAADAASAAPLPDDPTTPSWSRPGAPSASGLALTAQPAVLPPDPSGRAVALVADPALPDGVRFGPEPPPPRVASPGI